MWIERSASPADAQRSDPARAFPRPLRERTGPVVEQRPYPPQRHSTGPPDEFTGILEKAFQRIPVRTAHATACVLFLQFSCFTVSWMIPLIVRSE